jgi:hypothetical protein
MMLIATLPSALAQVYYPTQSVRVIVTTTSGGGLDTFARAQREPPSRLRTSNPTYGSHGMRPGCLIGEHAAALRRDPAQA